jgi:hypothetical protein
VEKIEIEDNEPIEAPTANEPPDAPATTPPPEADPVSTAVRLVVGTASLGLEAFRSRLRAWSQEPVGAAIAPTASSEAGTAVDAMVGTAARGIRTAASLGARGADLARQGLRTVGGATRSIGVVVPDFLHEPMDRARERAAERMRSLEEAGRGELDRSRAVARAALEDGLDAIIGRLADNRELRFVIRTQSTSVAEEAVEGFRGETARIDDRLEGAARKLLRRPPKSSASPR